MSGRGRASGIEGAVWKNVNFLVTTQTVDFIATTTTSSYSAATRAG